MSLTCSLNSSALAGAPHCDLVASLQILPFVHGQKLRMLASHPEVEVSCLTSRSEAGKTVASLYPWLSHNQQLRFEEPSVDALGHCDLVFYATPNKIAMHEARDLLERGVRVIDLAADFRFSDPAVWESAYGGPHGAPDLIDEAVYGLPEKYRHLIV